MNPILRLGAEIRDELLDAYLRYLPIRAGRQLLIGLITCNHGMRVKLYRGVTFRKASNIEFLGPAIINTGCILDGRGGKLTIGAEVDIGRDTHIWTLQHDVCSDSHGVVGKPVNIGHHVWLATRVTILPGVTIGNGAVVAAGSIVTRDVRDCEIVAGNPARPIGKRTTMPSYKLSFSFFF